MKSREIAEALGVYEQRVCDWKKGRRRISRDDAIKIIERCGLSATFVIYGKTDAVLAEIEDSLTTGGTK